MGTHHHSPPGCLTNGGISSGGRGAMTSASVFNSRALGVGRAWKNWDRIEGLHQVKILTTSPSDAQSPRGSVPEVPTGLRQKNLGLG